MSDLIAAIDRPIATADRIAAELDLIRDAVHGLGDGWTARIDDEGVDGAR